MNINPTMGNAQPSFQARIKKNEYMEKFVRGLNKGESELFKQALNDLKFIGEDDDVVEFRHIKTYDNSVGTKTDVVRIENTKNPKQQYIETHYPGGLRFDQMMQSLKELLNKNSDQHQKLFNDHKDIFDLMA